MMYKYLDIIIEAAIHNNGECGFDGHYVLYPEGYPEKTKSFTAPGIFLDSETAHAAIIEHAIPIITSEFVFNNDLPIELKEQSVNAIFESEYQYYNEIHL